MHPQRPDAEDIAAARYFVANRARLNLDPADALDLARTSWATLRFARPLAALPPTGARILPLAQARPAPPALSATAAAPPRPKRNALPACTRARSSTS